MNYISIKKIQKIKNIKKYKNKLIKIYGWIKNKRYSNIGIFFIDLKDGSSIKPIQIIVKKNKIKKYKKYINCGCSIKIIGIIKKNKKKNKNEIYAKKIKIIGKINNPENYPISSKYHSIEYLRKYLHLRPRTYLFESISKIRNTLIYSLHEFLQKKNFLLIPTPIITSLDTEGNSEMFEIKKKKKSGENFFNKKSFLTVSGQLNLETYACCLSNVYNIGPIFRAENSNTKKHLSEFWMLEIETVFKKINEIIKISKNILSYSLKQILKKNKEELEYISKYTKKENIKQIKKIINKEFIKITYKKAIKILKKNEKLFNDKIYWGKDISTEQENFLTKKYFKSSIIIVNHPKNLKPFYMKINKDNKTVSSMDIILPKIGEIIGGSERENNIKKLDKNIKKKKLNIKKYWWYRDLRIYGTIPHSGLGLGIERLLMYITNITNIRDITPFPRYTNYIDF